MVKCRFTATYWDYERRAIIDYICDAKEENVLESGFCIFHDENYLQDKKNSKEREQKVNIEFIDMVGESISQKKALVCIGYHLPNIIMRKLDFVKPVYFCNAKFQLIDFSSASFSEVAEADFDSAVFFGEVNFSSTKFSEAHFRSVEFSGEVNFRSVEFSGEVNFSSTKFSGGADFSSVKFSKIANFRSAIFSREANFSSAGFFGEARFSSASFSGVANFSSEFLGEADFFAAIFSGEANFNSAGFAEGADFNSAKFSKLSTFSLAKFYGESNFSSTKFSGRADLSSTKFSGRVNFNLANFYGESNFRLSSFSGVARFTSASFFEGADFNSAKFSKLSTFSLAKFSREANFKSARFSEQARFYSVGFSGGADFNSTKFFQEARFDKATLSEKADFTEANFYNEANFRSAKFSKAIFDRASFSGRANFHKAEFSTETFFTRALFLEADFTEAIFSGKVDFTMSTFLSKAYFSGEFRGHAYFNRITFEEPGKITFNVSNMSSVSFSDSDVTRIRFSDTVTWGGHDKFTTIEEKMLIEDVECRKKDKSWKQPIEGFSKDQSLSLELVLSVYRNLRENYEFRLRYGDAGKFFTKEMELKRKYTDSHSIASVFKLKLIKLLKKLGFVNVNAPEPKINYVLRENGWLRKHFSLTALYYHFSNYGESIIRPTIIGVLTVGLSTFFWLMQSKPTLEPHFFVSNSSSFYNSTSQFAYLTQAGNSTHWLAAFQRSIGDFLPVLSLPGDIKVGIIDYITKIVGGALTFGLLIIAFRRKFERKYTR